MSQTSLKRSHEHSPAVEGAVKHAMGPMLSKTTNLIVHTRCLTKHTTECGTCRSEGRFAFSAQGCSKQLQWGPGKSGQRPWPASARGRPHCTGWQRFWSIACHTGPAPRSLPPKQRPLPAQMRSRVRTAAHYCVLRSHVHDGHHETPRVRPNSCSSHESA